MTDVTTQYENDAFTTITDVTLLPAATTINVTSDTNFPAIASPNYFYATLEDVAGQVEVVKVTTHIGASNQFTVDRGADNTAALTFIAGDYIEMRPNAAVFEELRDAVATKADTTYVDSENVTQTALLVPRAGGVTLSGQLSTSATPPVADDQYTRKDYVDQFNFYDLPGAYPGLVLDSTIVFAFQTARAYNLPINLTGSQAYCVTAPVGGNPSLSIKKNGSTIGTIDFISGSSTGTFTFSAGVSFAVGDRITVTAAADMHDAEELTFNLSGVLIL